NLVYGRTNNPYSLKHSAGGSSGGDAAIVALGGAPFGVAHDVAGSNRIPGAFCGVFGYKPTGGLVPTTGVWPAPVGKARRYTAIGPICRHAEDLMPLLRILAGPDDKDRAALELPLRDPG